MDSLPDTPTLPLFDDTDSEDDEGTDNISEELCDFLTLATKGPQLDFLTVRLLSQHGVMDEGSFHLYTRLQFGDMITPIPSSDLSQFPKAIQGLRDLRIYGDYVHENSLVTPTTNTLDLSTMNIHAYALYSRSKRRAMGHSLREAIGHELTARLAAKQRLSELRAHLQATPASSAPHAPTPASTAFPAQTPAHPDFRAPSPARAVSPLVQGGQQQRGLKVNTTEQDLDDDVNPFHMVTPTMEDMHPHDDFVASPFTPANGSPTTDTGYSH